MTRTRSNQRWLGEGMSSQQAHPIKQPQSSQPAPEAQDYHRTRSPQTRQTRQTPPQVQQQRPTLTVFIPPVPIGKPPIVEPENRATELSLGESAPSTYRTHLHNSFPTCETNAASPWERGVGDKVLSQLTQWAAYAERGMGTTGARLFVLTQVMDLITEEARLLRALLPTATLTPQQLRTLSLLNQHYSLTEIATQIGVSRSTVESHLKNARIKLGVASRKDLLMLVRAEGIL